MDTVILAAGKGERLAGIAAPYHKPMMVVNGESLITRAVRQAHSVSDGMVILVVAPENALPIAQLTADMHVTMIVQRKPAGPGDALWEGLKLCREERVMVLMSDNYTEDDSIAAVLGHIDYPLVVGVQPMPLTQAERFTYRMPNGMWVEKDRSFDMLDDDIVDAWVGPVIMSTTIIREALSVWHGKERETPIGPLFNDFHGAEKLVPVHTIDIGTPEALA